MTNTLLLLSLFIVVMSGCSHGPTKSSTVALKVSEDEAHVGLGRKQVKPGDTVELFKRRCTSKDDSPVGLHCEKIKIGEGQVTETLNDSFSVVKVAPGVIFSEGTIVQKR
jgi:hypothetical protein